MEAGAVAVAGGVAAIGSSLAVRRGTSTTKILPASSTTRTTSNNNKKRKKKRPRRVISRIRSIRTKTEKRLEKKYPNTVFVVVTLRLMFELARYYADVVGDIAQLVWQMRNNDQLRAPFLAMVFFIGFQLCLGSAGRSWRTMRYEHKASNCRAPCLVRVLATARPCAGHAHAHVPADGALLPRANHDLHGAVRGGAKTDGGLNRVASQSLSN